MQDISNSAPEHDLKIVMGDFNVQVGAENGGWEETIGKEALGERTDNGERLLSYCSTNKLRIGGTLLQHKNIHKPRGGPLMVELQIKLTTSASPTDGHQH